MRLWPRSDMNLILLEENDFIHDDVVEISGHRLDHLKNVTRIEMNQEMVCGKLNSKMGMGRIVDITPSHCRLQVCLDREPPEPVPLNLVLALPRPKMFRRIIQAVTSLGVKKIHIINSWRVEKSFWNSPKLEPESVRQQMILGLEQAKDTIMPELTFHRYFKDFAQNSLSAIAGKTHRILAHPKSDKICPMAIDAPATLIVGPEGGFIPYEVETLEDQGFSAYHMGARVLRVETAVISLISRLFSYTIG